MGRMLRSLLVLAMLGACLSVASIAAAATVPKPATVSLDGTGVTGGWDGTTFAGVLRCRAGATDPRLTVTVTQGEATGTTVMSSVTCDGASHRFSIDVWPSNASRFAVGNAWVSAQLTANDPVTGASLPAGRDANNVWIRPSGKITPLWPLLVDREGTMTVTTKVLCRGPWFISQAGVEVRQPGASGAAVSAYQSEPRVACDGKTHLLRFVLTPPPGTSFAIKPSEVYLSLDLMDPVHFDPVDQWTWRGTVRVARH